MVPSFSPILSAFISFNDLSGGLTFKLQLKLSKTQTYRIKRYDLVYAEILNL